MIVGYARVSTLDQNELSQEKLLKEHGCERVFTDKASGKNLNRENFRVEAVKKERSSTDKHEFNIENFNYRQTD